jgi:hypothetical protein
MNKLSVLLSAGLEAFEAPPALADVTPPQLQQVFGDKEPAVLDTPPPGVEVVVVAPSPFDEGYVETPELLRQEIAAREVLVELINEERDANEARQYVANMRRASDGLEGLMVEIQNVNNPEEPTEDELAMLKSTASLVRKEVLDEGDQQVVIDLENGVLVGSQEGLGDAISNVTKKIKFALGNAAKNFASSGDKTKKPLTYHRNNAKELKERIGALKTSTFTFTLPAALVKSIAVSDSGKLDLVNDVNSLITGLEHWYAEPSASAAGYFDKHEAIIKACLATDSLEAFDKAYDAFKALKAPLPSSAKKIEPINGKDYVFDAYTDGTAMAGVSRWYYIARPNGQDAEQAVRAIREFNAGIFPYISMERRKGEDTEVSLKKADLLGMFDVITKGCGILDQFLGRLNIMNSFDKRYDALATDYNKTFSKLDWVNRDVQRKMVVAIQALDAYYAYGFSYTNMAFHLFDVIVKTAKKAVYKSDLSKTDEDK